MDGNKDEAVKCIGIAKEAIASGNKQRALKFIKIAQRLNHTLSLDDLLTACEKMDSPAVGPSENGNHGGKSGSGATSRKTEGILNEERNYTEEHVQLIRQINKHRDYYAVLGVEKTCVGEEIKKAYRKLSLKVHPDKNKAPGAEEAFKKVSKAFKCLSEEDSRRQYDQTGLVDEFEYNQQNNVRRRRRRTGNDFFDDEFDPDEIFRAFFGQSNVFHSSHVYRTRGMGTPQRTESNGGGPNLMVLLQLVPFLVILLLAYLPFSEPEYSLQRNYSYQFPRVTEKYGVEYFVKSSDFDRNYPIGSAARDNIEGNVVQEYKNLLGRYCHIELQRRQWSRNIPTPHCDKLQSFGVAQVSMVAISASSFLFVFCYFKVFVVCIDTEIHIPWLTTSVHHLRSVAGRPHVGQPPPATHSPSLACTSLSRASFSSLTNNLRPSHINRLRIVRHQPPLRRSTLASTTGYYFDEFPSKLEEHDR
ncbi:hypothetical protein KSS87_007025 [Heliosperma pusillum]|nr:hypothetical protein KSS87_007025 [Heliosperma pusillum]